MATPIRDFPTDNSASGIKSWAREVTFAIRALQSVKTTSTTSTAVSSSSTTSAPSSGSATVVTVATWGSIKGSLANQTDLVAALNGREPAFGIPTEFSIPYFDTDGTRGWFTLSALRGALEALTCVVTVSADTTLRTGNGVVIVDSAATITLPLASNYKNKQFTIVQSGTGSVTIAPTGSDTINGTTSLVLAAQWSSVVVVSDGTNWITCG